MADCPPPATIALVLNDTFRMRLSAHRENPETGYPEFVGIEVWLGEMCDKLGIDYGVERLGPDRARKLGSDLIRLADLAEADDD